MRRIKRTKPVLAVLLALAAILAHNPAWSADSKAPAPTPTPTPVIILPDNPTPPPPPVPVPPAMQTLSADQLYVVRASAECVVMASPDGMVKITAVTTPTTIRAKFIDGDGTYQTRTFSDKYLYTVEASAAGKCELIVVAGGTVVRRCLNVANGPAPGPTPTPPTPPTPTPNDPLTTAIQTSYSKDTDANKSLLVGYLIALFQEAAVNTSQEEDITTNAQLMTTMQKALKTIMPPSAMPAMKQALANELSSAFGTSPTAPIDRAKAKTELAKIASILGGLK